MQGYRCWPGCPSWRRFGVGSAVSLRRLQHRASGEAMETVWSLRLAALITLRTVAVGPTISVLHKQVTKCRLTSHTEGCENKFSSDSPSYSQPPLAVGTHISQGWLRRRENGCGRSGGRFERGFSSQSSGAGVQPGPGQVVEHKLEQLAVIVTNHSLRDNMRLHKDKSFLLRQNCRKRQQFHLWNISC